jgi:hypothetical protein
MVDLILNNGQGQVQFQGDVAGYLATNGRMDIGKMRPYMKSNGAICVNLLVGRDPKNPKHYKEFQINRMQTNGTLRRDEWKQLDQTIMEVSRQRLGGADDLISKGLVYNLGNGMATTVLEWHDVSDFGEAVVSMDGVTRGNNDRPKFKHNYLPIPIIHYDYEINARDLAASRNMGNPLDTTHAERATRKVLERLEKMFFTNINYSYGEKDDRNRNTIYSYINHPDRNTVSFTYGHWNDIEDSTATGKGAKIIKDVVNMKQASINALHFGPWQLYIPTAYETVLDEDYDSTTPGTTIRERILKIDGIKGIKVVDTLTADNILLVQMTSDVVRLVQGMGLTNVEWAVEGNMITKYKVMTIRVPQIRSDQNGKTGIVHMS